MRVRCEAHARSKGTADHIEARAVSSLWPARTGIAPQGRAKGDVMVTVTPSCLPSRYERILKVVVNGLLRHAK
jgi:hypothetical protein